MCTFIWHYAVLAVHVDKMYNTMYIPFHKSLGPKPSAIQTEMDQLFQSPLSHDDWCRILSKYHHPMGKTRQTQLYYIYCIIILSETHTVQNKHLRKYRQLLKVWIWQSALAVGLLSNAPVVQYRSHHVMYSNNTSQPSLPKFLEASLSLPGLITPPL